MKKKSPKQLFTKLFYRYTALLGCIVLALAVYFVSVTRNRILETNLRYRDIMLAESAGYVEDCSKTTGYILSELYQSSDILADLLTSFRSTSEEYRKYRLDTYMESPVLTYEGVDDYVEKAMQSYPDILSIEMISYEKSEVTTFRSDGKIYGPLDAKRRMEDVSKGIIAKKGVLAFVREIRNPDTLTGAGCMIVNFDTEKIRAVHDKYPIFELLVSSSENMVIYQSDKRLDTEAFLEAEDGEIAKDTAASYVEKTAMKDYTIYALADKRKSTHVPVTTILAILGMGLAIILLGEWCIRAHLLHLTKRLNEIIEGMHKVKTGDLNTRLAVDENGDELDVISAQFNDMCQDLDRHIQKSYLAEIQQKNAELEVLQNQINPHFLYNTLEAIRMKAICNGDREVGKMLYSMSVIFRSQLKDSDIITLIQEIHYCKKYLELFEYRYQGKFTSQVECPEELMGYPVMKFILQPIVENYFIHGMQAEREGNRIHIWVEKLPDPEEALLLHVEDNGKGMTHEELAEKNRELKSEKPIDKTSVGISNVNSRVRSTYGVGYGVDLLPRIGGGLHVIVKIGISKGE